MLWPKPFTQGVDSGSPVDPSASPVDKADGESVENHVVTFSFGKNWTSYLKTVDEQKVSLAVKDIEEWLGGGFVAGKTVLDVGCGSGIHSLGYYLAGAKTVLSFDADPYSVEATRTLWEQADRPPHWTVVEGSILDECFVAALNSHDIVYAWGVLHHTGSMWEALENTVSLINPGGLCWISIYTKGPNYPRHLALKETYNRSSRVGKALMVSRIVGRKMAKRLIRFENPFGWNERKRRGMTSYHDLIDWLGGLPYEVATCEEIVDFCEKRGLAAQRMDPRPEGSPSEYLFVKT